MESVLIGVISLSVLIILSSIIGFSSNNSANSFDVIKFIIHSVLFLLIAIIWFSSIFKLQGELKASRLIPLIALYLVGITLLANLIIALTSILFKKVNHKLVATHKYSSLLMAISVLTDIISLVLID